MKIPINHKLWPGIIADFIGIVLILRRGSDILNPGALYALGSSVCLSLVMISVRLLSYTEKHHTVLFYYCLIASVLSLPVAIYFWQSVKGLYWLLMVSIGILSFLG